MSPKRGLPGYPQTLNSCLSLLTLNTRFISFWAHHRNSKSEIVGRESHDVIAIVLVGVLLAMPGRKDFVEGSG